MFLSDFSIKRPISISMIVLGILITGLVSVAGMPLSLLPDITFPRVTVRTEYPQAAPAEVENIITRPVEQVVGILNNVSKITSVSKSGLSDVVVEFGWGTDLDVATMEMREKLQLIQFPDDVKKPLILRYDPSQDPIMTIGVTADMGLSDLRYMVEREIQRELERIDGVAAVKVQGGFEEEIVISLDEAKITRLGVNPADIADRISRENVNLAGGTLRDAGSELSVRTTNAFTNLDEIRDLVIKVGAGSTSASPIPGVGGDQLGGLMDLVGMFGMGGMQLPGGAEAGGIPMAKPAPMGDIRLRDIATVERKPKKRSEIARLDDRECIQVSIFKEGDANVVTVCRDLRRAIARIKASMRQDGAVEIMPPWTEIMDTIRRSPGVGSRLALKKLTAKKGAPVSAEGKLIADLKIVTIVDQAVFIEKAIDEIYSGAFWGAVIAVSIIYIFLRSWKSTLIIGLNIPISIISTFVLMYFFDISWNIMSLGGLALGVGVLDDNTIVVLENIYRIREQEGGSDAETAAKGASEVWTAVLASTLTNIVVFFPIVFIGGIAGQIFRDLALTVTFSMIMSQMTAFTIVPMLAVVLKLKGQSFGYSNDRMKIEHKAGEAKGGIVRGAYRAARSVVTFALDRFDSAFDTMRLRYPDVLAWVLDRPVKVMIFSILLSAISMLTMTRMGVEMIPSVDQGEFTIKMEMAPGTPIDVTDRKVAEVEREFTRVSGENFIKTMFTAIGYGTTRTEGVQKKSENLSEIHITLKPERPFGDIEIMERLRLAMGKVLTGVVPRMSRPTMLSYRNPIEIEISGNNLEELKALADVVATKIEDVPGVFDVESTGRESNPEVRIVVDRDKASHFGLTVAQVTDSIRKKIKGDVITDLDEGERQIDIILRLREEDRDSVANIENISIPRLTGDSVPLKVVADLVPGLGPGVIYRSSNSRVSYVTANLAGRPLGDAVRDIKSRVDAIRVRAGYFIRIAGENEEMKRSIMALAGATVLSILLVYLVLASSFESLLHPFVIMFAVPYSMIGVTLFLISSNMTLNVFTFIGVMMMLGIAVNDAILFVETTNQYREQGMGRREAIISAGRNRLRPIVITTLTTILGMVPMAVMGGEGAELRAPIAIASIGGLTTSTIFTMLAIPAVYDILDRVRPRRTVGSRKIE